MEGNLNVFDFHFFVFLEVLLIEHTYYLCTLVGRHISRPLMKHCKLYKNTWTVCFYIIFHAFIKVFLMWPVFA